MEEFYDFSWFTTVPGMFITGGVVLLLIALIILVITGKKSKKGQQAVQEANEQPQVAAQPMVQPEPVAVAPVEVAPVMPEVAPVEVAPVMPQVAPVEVAPVVEPAPTIYGGVSPSVEVNFEQPQNHQIYGGADPLENTQSIPAVQPQQPVEAVPVINEPVMVQPTEVAPAPLPQVEPVVPTISVDTNQQ